MDKSGQEDEFIENGILEKVDINNVKGKKRKKCLRDKTAPRLPHSGYIQFLSDKREQFRFENPNLSFGEITKGLATEWNQLPADKKKQYLLAAKQERVKYIEELAAYKKTDAYRNFIQRKLKKKKAQKLEKEKPFSDKRKTVNDKPINNELYFNKSREGKLRHLCKKVTDQQPEVSLLQEDNANTVNGMIKLKVTNQILEAESLKYERYLIKLRSLFLNAFDNITFPDNIERPTEDTIDTYMVKLDTHLTTGSGTDPSWIENVKKVISNLDFSVLK